MQMVSIKSDMKALKTLPQWSIHHNCRRLTAGGRLRRLEMFMPNTRKKVHKGKWLNNHLFSSKQHEWRHLCIEERKYRALLATCVQYTYGHKQSQKKREKGIRIIIFSKKEMSLSFNFSNLSSCQVFYLISGPKNVTRGRKIKMAIMGIGDRSAQFP